MTTLMTAFALSAFLLVAPSPAWAQWEIESDPMAFALKGYSRTWATGSASPESMWARSALASRKRDTATNGFAAGGRVGYRLRLGQSGLYVAPWVGVDYNFAETGTTIAGRTFTEKRMRLFPTVHVGWRF